MNKIKTVVIFVIAAVLTLPLFARDTEQMVVTEEPDNSSVWDRLYLQGIVGPNTSMNEDMRSSAFGKSVNWGGEISIGQEFNPYWGFHAIVDFSGDRATGYYAEVPRRYNTFHSVDLYLNGSYNLTNGFFGYRAGRKGNLYFNAGLGLSYSYGLTLGSNAVNGKPKTNELTYALRGSLTYVYNLSKRISLVGDIGLTGYGDNFNGRSAEVPLDFRFQVQAGVRIHLGRGYQSWQQSRIKYVDRHHHHHHTDTVRVVERMYEPAQNKELGSTAKIYAIFFAINSIEIRSSQQEKIEQMASYLIENPEKTVFILGYADRNTGNQQINYYLGKNRAYVVADCLTQNYGIDPARIITIQEEGDKVQPFKVNYENNRVAICIISDFTE